MEIEWEKLSSGSNMDAEWMAEELGSNYQENSAFVETYSYEPLKKTNNHPLIQTQSRTINANKIRAYLSEYKQFFVNRVNDQKMTETDSQWILNIFS